MNTFTQKRRSLGARDIRSEAPQAPTTAANASAVNERAMLDLLLDRYTAIRRSSTSDRWIRAEHVRSNMGNDSKRIADFIAVDKFPSSGLALHGHEVKVSRSDWLSELRTPAKAEAFMRYMDYWWLVVPDPAIVKQGELPAGWGLLVGSGNKLRAQIPAPKLTPAPLPIELSLSLASAAVRTANREPLRRDAPLARLDGAPSSCAACGRIAPCAIHQPRAHRAALQSSGAQDR
ncbi:MAG: hypothetical protein ACJA07_000498 [Rhodococcus sp. (in: high G+C Gram-positive bacteria)]|jgi:hypothetical protein